MDAFAVAGALSAVCPIDGVAQSLASDPWTSYPAADGSLWRLDFSAPATAVQQQAAIQLLATYVEPASVANAPDPMTSYGTRLNALEGRNSTIRLSGQIPVSTIQAGTITMNIAVTGLLRTDGASVMMTSTPPGFVIVAAKSNTAADNSLLLQVQCAALTVLSNPIPLAVLAIR